MEWTVIWSWPLCINTMPADDLGLYKNDPSLGSAYIWDQKVQVKLLYISPRLIYDMQ